MSNTPSLLPCPFCGGINIIHCGHHMYCHACGKTWRFDDGGPSENNMNFCHCCGKTLRIKGKEAVNADT